MYNLKAWISIHYVKQPSLWLGVAALFYLRVHLTTSHCIRLTCVLCCLLQIEPSLSSLLCVIINLYQPINEIPNKPNTTDTTSTRVLTQSPYDTVTVRHKEFKFFLPVQSGREAFHIPVFKHSMAAVGLLLEK